MRRVRYYEYGGPEVLRVEETGIPEPSAGQVLIKTEAIGANHVDTMFRGGGVGVFQRPLPGELTGDVVGTVAALGPGVGSAAVGDRVTALADPAAADYVLADAEWLAPVPTGLDAATATILAMAAPVALRVLRTGQLAAGETVLVHAAAGGIGHITVQLAKLLGAGTVIATASSKAKLDFARSYGADIGIDYTDEDWADQVRTAAPDGVDVIADSAGGKISEAGFDLLAPFGRAVLYGAASGAFADVSFRSIAAMKYVTGFSLIAWRIARPDAARAEMTELAEYVATGRLRAGVHASFPLTDIAKAHQVLDDRAQLGRVLITP